MRSQKTKIIQKKKKFHDLLAFLMKSCTLSPMSLGPVASSSGWQGIINDINNK